MEICDLHTHSIFSDGADTPTELINKAIESGLKAVALTDHNTIAGLLEFTSAGKEKGLETINGVEFSTNYKGKEVHVVSLFIKEKYFSELTSILAKHDEYKEISNIRLVEGLNKLGYAVDYEKIKKEAWRFWKKSTPCGVIILQGALRRAKGKTSSASRYEVNPSSKKKLISLLKKGENVVDSKFFYYICNCNIALECKSFSPISLWGF